MRMSLKLKAIAVILLFTVILSVSIVFISYNTYTDSFRRHYSSLALSISKSTASVVDEEKVKAVAEEVQKTYRTFCEKNGGVPSDLSDSEAEDYYAEFEYITDMPEYKELLEVLTKLREDNEAESLYLGYTDVATMKDLYLVDASALEPCRPGVFDDVQPEHVAKIEKGDYEFPAFITNLPEYGWLCSASAPIKDGGGNVVGVALVDISMNKIMSDRRDFLITLILITAVLALIIAAAVLILVNKFLIKPINVLSDAASTFVSEKQEKAKTDSSQIAKLNIRTGDEIEKLSDSVKKMETDLNTYIEELTAITSEKERIGAELDIATHIQSSMLPCIFPAFPERQEFDIYAQMTPAKEVGGDFYDFFMVDERHIAIVMADVSGKGVPAALFMVIAKTLIKDHTLPGRDLGEVFTTVNNILCESNSEGLFVTAFEGVLDLATGEFAYVNAGHEVPYLCKKSAGFKPYKIKPCFVLAGMENMKYSSGKITLDVGDKIFQYTDGVTEATNAENELYGAKRLNTVLNAAGRKTPCEIIKDVKNDIDTFVGNADQFDDITMLCLEYKRKMETEGN